MQASVKLPLSSIVCMSTVNNKVAIYDQFSCSSNCHGFVEEICQSLFHQIDFLADPLNFKFHCLYVLRMYCTRVHT